MDAATTTLLPEIAGDDLSSSFIGSRALMFDASGDFEIVLQQRIWGLADRIAGWREVDEVVAGVTNLLVVLTRSGCDDADRLCRRIKAAWHASPAKSVDGRLIEIPVIYGGEAAIDLEAIARHTALSPAEIVRIHGEGEYTVVTVASTPGFGYLHGLDPRINMPRKTTPTLNMPAGSVTIGGMLTGVSVATGPNGWNAIGFSEMRFFDAAAAEPSLLRAGDRIRFRTEKILL